MKIIIKNAKSWNWYKVDEIYDVKDLEKYKELGIQVFKGNTEVGPDVVQHGDYEFL